MSDPVKIVILDYSTFKVKLPKLSIDHTLIEYDDTPPEKLQERIADAEVIVTNKVKLSEAVLASARNLRLIVLAATGYDHIDINFCKKHGIAVANARSYADRGVAEHVMALLLAVARGIVIQHMAVHAGKWHDCETFSPDLYRMTDIEGKRLGIIGAGALGRATGSLATSMGLQVKYLFRGVVDDLPRIPFDELLRDSDVISLHCPLDESNAGMMGEEEFKKMNPNAILINTARGKLIDDYALIRALKNGTIAGAGIDVLDQEPPPKDHPLLLFRHHGLVITPHVAWSSTQSLSNLMCQISENIQGFIKGTPQNLIF